jgi:uncharacterized protein
MPTESYNLRWKQFRPNLFYIQGDQGSAVYAPLLGAFFEVGPQGHPVVDDFIRNGRESHEFYRILSERGFLEEVDLPTPVPEDAPWHPYEAMISLTSNCNLRCIYCYADAGHNVSYLPFHIVTQSIDMMLSSARRAGDEAVRITFHGGGEPLVMWDRLVRSVEYAESVSDGEELVFSVSTNATLISQERAEWLASRNFRMSVSVDGPREVQNRQRPATQNMETFEAAMRGLEALSNAGLGFGLRSTITGYSQHRLVELVEFAHSVGVKRIMAVPYSPYGRGFDGVSPVDPQVFVTEFERAITKAASLGVRLRMSTNDIERADSRFCRADGDIFAVMSDGLISGCTRVTRTSDALAPHLSLGHWDQQGVVIDDDRLHQLRSLNLYAYPECSDCFAKFACSGGCHADRLENGGTMPEGHCVITRGLVWLKLVRALGM